MQLELKNISLRLGGKPLFQDFSLGVAEGEKILVKGPSGSGKSTLLRLILGFATFSAINNSELNYRKFLAPVFTALFLSAGSILLFFNGILLDLSNIFTAQYLIIIGGMLLGNALKGIIIGIADFYKAIHNGRGRYLYHLSAGAGQSEICGKRFSGKAECCLLLRHCHNQ